MLQLLLILMSAEQQSTCQSWNCIREGACFPVKHPYGDRCQELHIAHFAWQAEIDFAGLAARLRDGEGRAAETDRAAREALHRCGQTEAQLQSSEVCCHSTCTSLSRLKSVTAAR